MDISKGSVKGKKIIITGAVKAGIGHSILERLLTDGDVSIALLASNKSENTDDFLQSCRKDYSADVRFLKTDLTNQKSIKDSVDKAASMFGGVDIVIHAASAMLPTTETNEKFAEKYILSRSVNSDSTVFLATACLPYFKLSSEANFLNICPPLDMEPKILSRNIAYTSSQYSRSLMTVALANHPDWKDNSIHVNALWPLKPSVDSNLFIYQSHMEKCERKSSLNIMAEAAHYILSVPRSQWQVNGEFLYDEEVLEMVGVNFSSMTSNESAMSSSQKSYGGMQRKNFGYQQEDRRSQPINNYISGNDLMSGDDEYL